MKIHFELPVSPPVIMKGFRLQVYGHRITINLLMLVKSAYITVDVSYLLHYI